MGKTASNRSGSEQSPAQIFQLDRIGEETVTSDRRRGHFVENILDDLPEPEPLETFMNSDDHKKYVERQNLAIIPRHSGLRTARILEELGQPRRVPLDERARAGQLPLLGKPIDTSNLVIPPFKGPKGSKPNVASSSTPPFIKHSSSRPVSPTTNVSRSTSRDRNVSRHPPPSVSDARDDSRHTFRGGDTSRSTSVVRDGPRHTSRDTSRSTSVARDPSNAPRPSPPTRNTSRGRDISRPTSVVREHPTNISRDTLRSTSVARDPSNAPRSSPPTTHPVISPPVPVAQKPKRSGFGFFKSLFTRKPPAEPEKKDWKSNNVLVRGAKPRHEKISRHDRWEQHRKKYKDTENFRRENNGRLPPDVFKRPFPKPPPPPPGKSRSALTSGGITDRKAQYIARVEQHTKMCAADPGLVPVPHKKGFFGPVKPQKPPKTLWIKPEPKSKPKPPPRPSRLPKAKNPLQKKTRR